MAAAEAEELPFVIETGQETWSDADGLSGVGGGIACGMVSIPLRYMHSAGEIAQLSDIDATSPRRRSCADARGLRSLTRTQRLRAPRHPPTRRLRRGSFFMLAAGLSRWPELLSRLGTLAP